MNPKINLEYLDYLSERLDEFMSAFDQFMALHVETGGPGGSRGYAPAVVPREDAAEKLINDLTDRLNHLSGELMDLSNITGVLLSVQGIKIDPFANWATITQPKSLLEPSDIRRSCLQAVGRIKGLKARAAALSSPAIDPAQLHPIVWSQAQQLWNDGHLREAVAAAAGAVTNQMKARTDRNDAQDTALWQQAFSKDKPEPGKPRLRWPGDPSDKDVQTMNDGLRLFAPGVNMVIRNPAVHRDEDMTEQEALEQLATLSLLARFLEKCVVDSAESTGNS
jgi:hypothetical protein